MCCKAKCSLMPLFKLWEFSTSVGLSGRVLLWLTHVNLAFHLCLFARPKWRNRKKTEELGRCGVEHFTKEVFNTLFSFIFLNVFSRLWLYSIYEEQKTNGLEKRMEPTSPSLSPSQWLLLPQGLSFCPPHFYPLWYLNVRSYLWNSCLHVFVKGWGVSQQTRACLARQRPRVQSPGTNSNSKAVLRRRPKPRSVPHAEFMFHHGAMLLSFHKECSKFVWDRFSLCSLGWPQT